MLGTRKYETKINCFIPVFIVLVSCSDIQKNTYMKRSELLTLCVLTILMSYPSSEAIAEDIPAQIVGAQEPSERLTVFKVNREIEYDIDGKKRFVGAGFQPSALLDSKGSIHVFFQARLDGSGDKSEKLIGHVISKDNGKTFSNVKFVNQLPMQTYAISSFTRKLPSGVERISLMTSLSIDETIGRLENPALINKRLGIDVSSFTRKAACLVLEFYSDDGGKSWKRKEHRGVSDRVYKRNGRDYYLAFINLIGQVRKIETGPHAGRLILAGPLRGDYLPCQDHARFRSYQSSSSVIYSDDSGESWKFGGVINDKTTFEHNEASAVSVDGGKQILMVRRRNKGSDMGKIMHYSNDGGATWGKGFASDIAATRCLQVMETCGDFVLCSAPGKRQRKEGRIYYSRDNGRSWSFKVIDEGPFSYSTVNGLKDKYLICCYSLGHHGEQGIAARIFSTRWIDTK